MTTGGIPGEFIGAPGTLPGAIAGFTSLGGEFSYAWLFPPQPTFPELSFNFDTDLLNPSTPVVTDATSLDIARFINFGHKIIWFHGLSDPVVPALGTIKYYEEMAQQRLGAGAAVLALLPGPEHGPLLRWTGDRCIRSTYPTRQLD
jgi:Tannase and feruloyl esterase